MLLLRLIWRDFRQDWRPTLSLLLILSLTIVISGLLAHLRLGLNQRLVATYEAGNPPDLILHTSEFKNPAQLDSLSQLSEVVIAEPVRVVHYLRLQFGDEIWRTVILTARPADRMFATQMVVPEGQIFSLEPGIMIERSGLALSQMGPGDVVQVDAWDAQHEIEISGRVYSPSQMHSQLSQRLMGYTSLNVLESLTGISTYDRVYVQLAADRVADPSEDAIRQALARDDISLSRIEVGDPSHPLAEYLEPTDFLFQAFGWLAIVLAILLINTIAAGFIAQRRTEIGRLKGLGFSQRVIWAVYLGGFLTLGVCAAFFAIPFSTWVGEIFLDRFAAELNLEFGGDQWPVTVWGRQLLIGLMIPFFAAGLPMVQATRQPTAALLQQNRHRALRFGTTVWEQRLNRLEWLSPVVLYGLRNLFRHKLRLLYMLLPITVAGAILMTTLNLRLSLLQEIERSSAYWREDIRLELPDPVGVAIVRNELLAIDGIVDVEGRLIRQSRRIQPSGDVADRYALAVVGLPVESRYLNPAVISGRWLMPEDTAHIVINTDFLRTEPDLQVGDLLNLEVSEIGSIEFEIVGIVTGQLIGVTGEFREPIAYVPDRFFQEQTAKLGQATHYIVGTDAADDSEVYQIARELEDALKGYQISPDQLDLIRDLRFAIQTIIQTTIRVVIILFLLFGLVGLLSLGGLLRLNLFERSNELKNLHALGFNRTEIFGICAVETLMIVGLSLGLVAPLAWGLTSWTNRFLGQTFINHSLEIIFDPWHLLMWGIIICVVSILMTFFFVAQFNMRRGLLS